MRTVVSLCSACTCLVSAWMAVMFLTLRHPHYEARSGLAAFVFAGAAALLPGRPAASFRGVSLVWGAALAVLGAWAVSSPGDDGWVLVAGSLFVVEGLLAVASAWPTSRTREGNPARI